MTRNILIATAALTWLLAVALPVGAVLEAWLLDVAVYGMPPAPPMDAVEPPAEPIPGADA